MSRLAPVRLYLLVWGLFNFAEGLALIAFPLNLIQNLHLDPLQLVLAGTALEATSFFCEIPTGIVADVYSRRLSAIMGHLLLGAGFVVLGLATNFAIVLVGQAVLGVGWTFINGAFIAWLTDEVGEDKVGDILLRSSQIGAIAGLLGNGVGVALGTLSLDLPLVLCGVLLIATAGLMSLLMPEHNFTPIPRAVGQGNLRAMFTTARLGFKVMQSRPLARVIVAVGFFLGLFSEGPDRLWEKHFVTNISFPDIGWNVVLWFGLIETIAAILSYFAASYARKRVRLESSQRLIQALLVVSSLMSGALFGFAVAGNFLLAFLTGEVFMVSRAVLSPLYNTWINQNLDSRVRATVLSFSTQLDEVGQVAAGPLIGVVGNGFSLRAALLLSTSLLLPVPLLFSYASRRTKGGPSEGNELKEVEA